MQNPTVFVFFVFCFFPHVLMISANLANQWNPKHFHKMSEISQNTVFFHVFLVFSHSNCGVILSCYSGGPFFSHSKFGVSSFGTRAPHSKFQSGTI